MKGHLDLSWSEWFGAMMVIQDANGETILAGTLTDQAALQVVLRKVNDLGIPLISVNPADNSPQNSQDDGNQP